MRDFMSFQIGPIRVHVPVTTPSNVIFSYIPIFSVHFIIYNELFTFGILYLLFVIDNNNI